MTKQARTLNEQELQKLLQAATNTKHPQRNRTILLLTHLAGMRVGEVAAVKIGDVVQSDKTVLTEIKQKAQRVERYCSMNVCVQYFKHMSVR